MSRYELEIGEDIFRLRCRCCGQTKKRVLGFVTREGDAHAVYYALLNVSEEKPRVGLTLSVGPWWDGSDTSQRNWVHVEVRPGSDRIQMALRDPQQSNFYPWPRGGVPLNPEEARASRSIEEMWAVADFIVETDPAVSSYLNGEPLNEDGREQRDAEDTARC